MVNACSYCGKKRAPGRVLYRIPFSKNEEQAKKWIESMNLGPGFNVLPNFMLCSEHFEKDCYYNIRGMEHRLKPGCVPTKFGVFIRLCIACKSKRTEASKTFHFFPLKNSTQFEKWVTAVGCNSSDITRNTVLCSDHFEKSCYYNLLPAYKMRLRELSVPTVFNTYRSYNSEEVEKIKSGGIACLKYVDIINEVSQSIDENEITDESDPLTATDSTKSTQLSTFNLKELRVLLEHCDPFTYNNCNTTKDNLNVEGESTVKAFSSKLQPEIGIVKRSLRKRKKIFDLKDIIPSIISDEEDDEDYITEDNDHQKSTSLSNVKKVNSNERYPKKSNCKRVLNMRDSKPSSCTVNKNENSASQSVNFVKVIAERPRKMSSHCVSEKGEEKPIVKTVVRVSTEKICRICGKISDSLEPIFNRNIPEETDLPVLIRSHLPIMVNESDVSWPKNICDLCVQVLIDWDKLYKKCVHVDAKFNQMFKKFSTETTIDNIDIKNEELPQPLSVSLNGHDYAEKNLLQNVYNRSVNDNKENEVLPESEKKSKTTEFKIGLKIVKENDCIENNSPAAELDLSSLKTILSTKVNQLLQSICNDEVIGKSLIANNLTDNDNDISGIVKQTSIENNVDNVEDLDKLKRSKTTRKSKQNVINKNKSVGKRRKSDTMISKNNDDGLNKDEINNSSGNIVEVSEPNHHPVNEGNLKKPLNKLKQKKKQYRKPVLCYECGKLSTSRLNHLKHRSSYHEQRKCDYCNSIFCGTIEYKKHLKIIHHEKLMVNCCELCGATFIRDEQLNAHKLRLHNIGDYHHCDLCDKKYPTRLGLLNHKSEVHPQKECICQLCDKKFLKRTSLKNHMKVDHGVSKFLSFECCVCHRVFPNSILHQKHCLAQHMDVLTSEQLSQLLERASKMYFCIICGIRSSNIELLMQHMSFHENDEDVKRNLCGQDEVTKFNCVICGKYLNTKKDLALHRYYAHKEPPFTCTLFGCRKSFWKQSLVAMHYSSEHKGVHVHNSKVTYNCPSCPATFSNHLMKARHIRNFHNVDENGVKRKKVMKTPYACETCDKRFNSKYILSMHVTSHSNAKHHKCPHCNRAFKLQFTLRKHLLSHEKDNDISKKEQNHSTKERLETIISEAVEKDKDEIVVDNKQQVFEEIIIEQEVFDENVIQHKVVDVYKEQTTEDNLIIENTVTVFDENQSSLKPAGIIEVCALFKCSYCELLFQDRTLVEKHCHEVHRDENYGLEIFS